MTGRLLLPGLRFFGHHGASAAEATLGGPIEVDLEVEVDLDLATATDRVEDTVDYRLLHAVVRELVEDERFSLLETLACAIATRVLQLRGVRRVDLRVAKEPRLPGQTQGFAVAISRSRSGPAGD